MSIPIYEDDRPRGDLEYWKPRCSVPKNIHLDQNKTFVLKLNLRMTDELGNQTLQEIIIAEVIASEEAKVCPVEIIATELKPYHLLEDLKDWASDEIIDETRLFLRQSQHPLQTLKCILNIDFKKLIGMRSLIDPKHQTQVIFDTQEKYNPDANTSSKQSDWQEFQKTSKSILTDDIIYFRKKVNKTERSLQFSNLNTFRFCPYFQSCPYSFGSDRFLSYFKALYITSPEQLKVYIGLFSQSKAQHKPFAFLLIKEDDYYIPLFTDVSELNSCSFRSNWFEFMNHIEDEEADSINFEEVKTYQDAQREACKCFIGHRERHTLKYFNKQEPSKSLIYLMIIKVLSLETRHHRVPKSLDSGDRVQFSYDQHRLRKRLFELCDQLPQGRALRALIAQILFYDIRNLPLLHTLDTYKAQSKTSKNRLINRTLEKEKGIEDLFGDMQPPRQHSSLKSSLQQLQSFEVVQLCLHFIHIEHKYPIFPLEHKYYFFTKQRPAHRRMPPSIWDFDKLSNRIDEKTPKTLMQVAMGYLKTILKYADQSELWRTLVQLTRIAITINDEESAIELYLFSRLIIDRNPDRNLWLKDSLHHEETMPFYVSHLARQTGESKAQVIDRLNQLYELWYDPQLLLQTLSTSITYERKETKSPLSKIQSEEFMLNQQVVKNQVLLIQKLFIAQLDFESVSTRWKQLISTQTDRYPDEETA